MAHFQQQPVAIKPSSAPNALVPHWSEAGPEKAIGRFGAAPHLVEVEVPTGRLRNYPGLVGPAPRTELYYRAFSRFIAGKSVVDLGCGSGSSLVHFREAKSVIGVDSDQRAIDFARCSVGGVQFERAELQESLELTCDVVSMVDVLGLVKDPRVVLDNASELLPIGGILCIAEPRAQVAQGLLSPARRAFSKAELSHLLEETGFRVKEWLNEGAFLVAVAEREGGKDSTWFMLGHRLRLAGELVQAAEAFGHIAEDSSLFIQAQLEIFELRLERGAFEDALLALMSAQKGETGDARVLSALSTASLLLGEWEDARRFAEASQEFEPNTALAAVSFAQSLRVDAPCGERLAAWLNAARLAPSDTGVAIALARVATEAEAYQLGAASLERVRRYHERLPADFHLTLGWLYVMVDRLEDALMESRLVALLEPSHSGLSDLVGSICAAQPRPFGVS